MKLYLVQHAEALSKAEDSERPLSKKGRANIVKVAAYIADQAGISPEIICHSGKVRAEQTAAVLAEYLHPPKGVRAAEGLEPAADPMIWNKKIATMTSDILLVGHLPHLARLAAALLSGDSNRPVVAFQNAGVVCLCKDETDGWLVTWMITPDLIA